MSRASLSDVIVIERVKERREERRRKKVGGNDWQYSHSRKQSLIRGEVWMSGWVGGCKWVREITLCLLCECVCVCHRGRQSSCYCKNTTSRPNSSPSSSLSSFWSLDEFLLLVFGKSVCLSHLLSDKKKKNIYDNRYIILLYKREGVD